MEQSLKDLRITEPGSSGGASGLHPGHGSQARFPTRSSSLGPAAGAAQQQAFLQHQAAGADATAASGYSPTSSPGSGPSGVSYNAERVIGNGSFGVVFLAKVVETGETVAIKKVLQDRRYKNRELQIMKMVSHRNIVGMRHFFYSSGEKTDEVYLNLVLEYVPDTVYRFYRQYIKAQQQVPVIYVKLFTYQLLRSLNFIHQMGICHRDIKPQNLLIDASKGILKLCDFGSAKQLIKGEPNVSYICSRYYRAPELIFGATDYTASIDVWSAGCVMAEMFLGSPLFPGESSVDQLVEIIKVLGTPTKEQIEDMNKNYTEFKFPQVKPAPWSKVFRNPVPASAVDLLQKLLCYSPSKRISSVEACCHPFFDEIRDPATRLPGGATLPVLFDWSDEELRGIADAGTRAVLRNQVHGGLPSGSAHSSSPLPNSPTAASPHGSSGNFRK